MERAAAETRRGALSRPLAPHAGRLSGERGWSRLPPIRQPGAVLQVGSGCVGGEAPGDHDGGGGQAGRAMRGGRMGHCRSEFPRFRHAVFGATGTVTAGCPGGACSRCREQGGTRRSYVVQGAILAVCIMESGGQQYMALPCRRALGLGNCRNARSRVGGGNCHNHQQVEPEGTTGRPAGNKIGRLRASFGWGPQLMSASCPKEAFIRSNRSTYPTSIECSVRSFSWIRYLPSCRISTLHRTRILNFFALSSSRIFT